MYRLITVASAFARAAASVFVWKGHWSLPLEGWPEPVAFRATDRWFRAAPPVAKRGADRRERLMRKFRVVRL